MSTDLSAMLDRLVLMQKAVMPGSDAVPVSFYSQEGLPFWTNKIDSVVIELDSQDIQVLTYRIRMRQVLAFVTEGWDQEAEGYIATWLPTVTLYFGQRRQLRRTSADSDVINLDPRGALLTDVNAVDGDMQNSGIGANQFGLDYYIEVPMIQNTDQLVK